MDRGIPTEEVLEQMRHAEPSVRYLVGTPKGRLTKLEKDLASKDWQQVKDEVHVKLLPRDGELYVLARQATSWITDWLTFLDMGNQESRIPPATPGGREGRSPRRGLGGEGNGVERPLARRGPGAAAPE